MRGPLRWLGTLAESDRLGVAKVFTRKPDVCAVVFKQVARVFAAVRWWRFTKLQADHQSAVQYNEKAGRCRPAWNWFVALGYTLVMPGMATSYMPSGPGSDFGSASQASLSRK